jgi:hypothetical protein
MKTWVWLVLTIMSLLMGCAQGYYESGPAYQAPAPVMSGMTYENPETTEQYEMRIWRESMSP